MNPTIEELKRTAGQMSPEEARLELERLQAEADREQADNAALVRAVQLGDNLKATVDKLKTEKAELDAALIALKRQGRELVERYNNLKQGIEPVFGLAVTEADARYRAGMVSVQRGAVVTTNGLAEDELARLFGQRWTTFKAQLEPFTLAVTDFLFR